MPLTMIAYRAHSSVLARIFTEIADDHTDDSLDAPGFYI